VSQELRRGISLGNALDTARDESPRLEIQEGYLAEIRKAGFDFVRLPIRWSAFADASDPYRIEEAFFERVRRAVEDAGRFDLTVVLNVHHYHELQREPDVHADRFVAIWRQIAARYANRSRRLLFELLNEPRDALTAPLWNELLARALAAVRESSPDRTVIVGPVSMNDVVALPGLHLPRDDGLHATIHYYAPFQFTHQGARWLPDADRWLGTEWGDDDDRAAVSRDLEQAADWARERRVPLVIGEFGVYDRADPGSRQRWTAFVRCEAERLGLGWCYWDFGTDFGAYDLRRGAWREPIRDALLATPS
jgi:endoglucanase